MYPMGDKLGLRIHLGLYHYCSADYHDVKCYSPNKWNSFPEMIQHYHAQMLRFWHMRRIRFLSNGQR